MTITVMLKNAFGKMIFYPVDDLAVTFTEMMGRKSFTYDQIVYLKIRGFDVIVKQEEFKI